MPALVPKSQKKRIIVIGAGVGGMSVAARLSSNPDIEVIVLEKNSFTGGRCSLIEEQGYRFDQGPSLLLMPQIFKDTFKDLNDPEIQYSDLNIVKCNPNYLLHFDDGTHMRLSTDMVDMKEQVEKFEKNGFDGLLSFMAEGKKHYDISVKHVLNKPFEAWYQFFNLESLQMGFDLHIFSTMWGRVCLHFKSEKLRRCFTFQSMYMGMSPFEGPGTYNLLQYTELAEGIWYPIGGFHKVVEAMETIAKKRGVSVQLSTPVQKIDIDTTTNMANGVILADGTKISADAVVVNADLVYAYNKLLPASNYGKKLKEMSEFTSSTFSFYWAMNQQIPELDAHNVFIAKDFKESFDEIFKDFDLPKEISFYIHVPSRIDPTAAPSGCDALTVLVPVGHIHKSKQNFQDFAKLQKVAKNMVIKTIETRLKIKNFEKMIQFELVNTPENWQNKFNLEHGSALGLSHSVTQVCYMRPSSRHSTFKNVFFVGASTHPGTGVPIVLHCAKLVQEQIERCLKNGFKAMPAIPNAVLTQMIAFFIAIIGITIYAYTQLDAKILG